MVKAPDAPPVEGRSAVLSSSPPGLLTARAARRLRREGLPGPGRGRGDDRRGAWLAASGSGRRQLAPD